MDISLFADNTTVINWTRIGITRKRKSEMIIYGRVCFDVCTFLCIGYNFVLSFLKFILKGTLLSQIGKAINKTCAEHTEKLFFLKRKLHNTDVHASDI
jgi:hypothetical protein